MAALKLYDDEGYLDVEFVGREGAKAVRLDLYETQCALIDAARAQEGAGDGAAWRAWGEWLVTQGAPALSLAELYRLNAALEKEVGEYKKKVLDSSNPPESGAPSACPSSPMPSPT